MAWRSGGTTNDEMVNNLKRFGVIHSQSVEDGFRAVDRRFFVPTNRQSIAHSDQPLKEGNVHISAPHIYGSVLEALELTSNSPLSFLNIGSGTGYLTCIAAEILGPTSTHYGVELHADVLEHSRSAMEAWKASRTSPRELPSIELIHGNGLQIDGAVGHCRMGHDRIYIGAAVEKQDLRQLASLLKPGGILVGPVEDELVKVFRLSATGATSGDATPRRSSRSQSSGLSEDFSQQVISGVRFAPLVRSPSIPTVLPSRVWSPEVHATYPESFRAACKQILLCSHASPNQPPPETRNLGLNMAGKLPRALWMEVLSYARHDWFEQPRAEDDVLRRRLQEAQLAAQRAHEARLEAESRLHLVERERDVYRLLAQRWQRRLQTAMSERMETGTSEGSGLGDDDIFEGIDDVAAASIFGASEPLILRWGPIVRRFQRQGNDGAGDDDEDDDLDSDGGNEEDEDHEDMDEDSESSDDEETVVDEPMESVAGSSMLAASLSVRPQVRTVSITSDDL